VGLPPPGAAAADGAAAGADRETGAAPWATRPLGPGDVAAARAGARARHIPASASPRENGVGRLRWRAMGKDVTAVAASREVSPATVGYFGMAQLLAPADGR
jgi:hypothetical protein